MRRSYFITVRTLAMGALAGCCLLLGCINASDKGDAIAVSGKITLDGKPFLSASIQFTSPSSGASFFTDLDDDGAYALELVGAEEGEVFGVSFGPIIKPPAKVKLDLAGVPKSNPSPPIPKRYLEEASSNLNANLGTAPKQTFDFQLQPR